MGILVLVLALVLVLVLAPRMLPYVTTKPRASRVSTDATLP